MKDKKELETELNTLKGKYTTVFTLEVPLNDEETEIATIYLRKADRLTYASVGKLAQGSDPIKAVEACLKALYIGGDTLSLVTLNDDALLSCEAPIIELLQKKSASLKKN
jgi:hypothetical protein